VAVIPVSTPPPPQGRGLEAIRVQRKVTVVPVSTPLPKRKTVTLPVSTPAPPPQGRGREASRVREFPAGNKATSSSRIAFLNRLCGLSKYTAMVDLVPILVRRYPSCLHP